MAIKGVLLSTKEGKLLFYRNYSKIAHSLFEDFAFSLPQKIKIENQHTFSNHGNNRLIYLPLDSLLIVLVTSMDSNIIEDIETVNMMKEILYTVLQQKNNEEGVYEHYVDLAFSFDDMINLQTRNNVSQNQIMALLEMDSNNEKLHNNMMDQREKEQKKKTEAEFRKLEKSKKIQSIIDKELISIDKSLKDFSINNIIDKEDVNRIDDFLEKKVNRDLVVNKRAPKMKGIKLGGQKKKKTNLTNMFDFKSIQKKQEKEEEEEKTEKKSDYNPLSEEIILTVNEKISGKITSEGEYSFFELKGTFFIYVKNPNLERFDITVKKKDKKYLNLKLPPNFDKKLWKKDILSLKKKASSLQKNTLIETLKYTLNYTDLENTVPFNISFWFSGKEFSSEIEFNEDQNIFSEIKNIKIIFKKLQSSDQYKIKDTENSTILQNTDSMQWITNLLNIENSSSSLILNFEEDIKEEELFPAIISIECDDVLLNLEVLKVQDESGRDVKFEFKKVLTAKDFIIN